MSSTTHVGTEDKPVFVGLDCAIGDAVEGWVSWSGDRTKPDNIQQLADTEYWWGRGETSATPVPNPYLLDSDGGAHDPSDPLAAGKGYPEKSY